MNHKWTGPEVRGVMSGSGRPHGVDQWWTCKACGAVKSRGPQSTATGKRVIRWRYVDEHGNPVVGLGCCGGAQ